MYIPFLTAATTNTATILPDTLREGLSTSFAAGDTPRGRVAPDLSNFSRYRLTANIEIGGTGAGLPRMKVRYTLDDGGVWTDLDLAGTTIDVKTVGDCVQSAWLNIDPLARVPGAQINIFTISGTTITGSSVTFGSIGVELE